MKLAATLSQSTPTQRLSWIGNGFLLLGAVALSMSPKIAAGWQVFVAFSIGHLLWIVVSLRRKDSPAVALNCGLMLLDFYAVYIRYPGVLHGTGLS
jgi:hypothetical protein